MAESYSVTAILSAQDKNFSSVFGSAQGAADSLAGKLKSGLGFGVLVGIGQKAFSTLTGSVSGFTGELEATSAAWQTFSKNAEMNGHTAEQIAATKKELQSFAQQTIYSASDMATTYAQLDAVGIKSAESLVKGFGGIAAAAENPQQAMKTLSQQGVQMAAKPKVAWQDFKLMLEQTPAGIAAVADEMGMTTSEMVQAVQAGEVATDDFFAAIQKVGTSADFTDLATSYKTTGQALDGLSETVTNTLMPAFEVFQTHGIGAIEKVIGLVEKFDGQKLADSVSGLFDAFQSGGITGVMNQVSGMLDSFGKLAPSLVTTGTQMVTSLVQGVAAGAPQFITGAITVVGGFASGLLANAPTLLASGVQLVTSIAQGISANLPRMAQGAAQALQAFAGNLMANLPIILSGAAQIVTSLVSGIIGALPRLAAGAVGIIGTLATGFIQNLPQIIQTGVQIIASLAMGLIGGIGTLVSMVPQIFGTIKDAVINTDWLSVGKQIITAIGDGIMGAIGGIGGKVGELLGGIGDWITGGNKAGTDYATAASESITANTPTVSTAVTTAATMATDTSANMLLAGGTQSGLSMMTGLSTGITANTGLLTDSTNTAMASATSILNDGTIQSDADSAGQGLVESAASGIDAGASAAESAIQSTMASALSAVSDSSSEASSAGQQLGTSIIDGFTMGIEPLGETAQTSIQSMVTSVQEGAASLQSAGQQAGARFSNGIRTGLTQASSVARTSAKAIISALKSSVSPAQAAGRQAGAKFAAGIRAGMSAARSAGTTIGKNAVNGMKAAASSARSAGVSIGSKFASGVSSRTGSARSAGSSLAHAAKSGMSGVSTTSIGAYMGQGLANGINSKYGTVASAARRLANVAAQAMRDAARVASPSKVTKQIGGYIGAGLGIGIQSKTSFVQRTASRLVSNVTSTISGWGNVAAANIGNSVNTLKNAFGANMKTVASSIASSFSTALKAKMKNVSDSAAGLVSSASDSIIANARKQQEKYQKAYTKRLKVQKQLDKKAKGKSAKSAEKKKAAQYAAATKKYKANADKYKKLVTSYTKAGSAIKSAFTSAFSTQVNAAITNTTNAINKLGETYQANYDAIIKARTDFAERMRKVSLGEYDDDKKAVTALTDYNVARRQVQQYGANLEKLKGILPSGMMDEILAMDTEQGLAYTEKLLSKGTSWLKEYAKSYNSFMNATTNVSNKYYQSQINTLKSNYTKAVENEFKKLQSSLKTIGTQVMQGFADGMRAKKTALDNAGKTLANSLINTLKTKLKIHSPSKVTESLGSYTGQGFVDGVEDQVGAARAAMQKLVETPRPQVAMAAGAENLRLHDEYNYTSNHSYRFEAVTELDGREIARSTAEYTEDELERRRKNSERIKGRR